MSNTEKSARTACTKPVLSEELIEALSLLGEVKRLVTKYNDELDEKEDESSYFPQFESDIDNIAEFIGGELQVSIHKQFYYKEA